MERLAALYRRVDGFVIVSGEYNHGIPPALRGGFHKAGLSG
jgi:NAD(P)H-dependent FMN reductase